MYCVRTSWGRGSYRLKSDKTIRWEWQHRSKWTNSLAYGNSYFHRQNTKVPIICLWYSCNSTRFLSLFKRAHLLVKTRIHWITVVDRSDTIILLKLNIWHSIRRIVNMYASQQAQSNKWVTLQIIKKVRSNKWMCVCNIMEFSYSLV